jgi:transposase
MAGGRPTKYKKIYAKRLVDLMREGASIEEVCYELNIGKQTLYDWVEKYPEFSDAKKRGVELSKAWWMRQGRTKLENKNFNYTGWYMNMKNRFGWSDKTVNENKNTEVHKVDLDKLTDAELRKIAEMQRKIGTSET